MNDSLDCLQAYKEYLIEREMSENTIEKYLRDVRAFVRYMGGRELERAEVLRYKKELLAQYKITSANSMLTALNHFFKWLGRNELCMKTCRQQRQIFRDAEKDLTREEYRRLLNPHVYKVDMSDGLYDLKQKLIRENKKQNDEEIKA